MQSGTIRIPKLTLREVLGKVFHRNKNLYTLYESLVLLEEQRLICRHG